MSFRSRVVSPALIVASLATGCSGAPSAEHAPRRVTVADCVPDSKNVTDLRIRSAEEAIYLATCVTKRINNERAQKLVAALGRAEAVEVSYDTQTGEYVTVSKAIPPSSSRTGARIALVGSEHINSADSRLQKLADPKDPTASALTHDSTGRPLILLASMVAPSVLEFNLIHAQSHSEEQGLPCGEAEANAVDLLGESFRAIDSRHGEWLDANLSEVHVSQDALGQLSYNFGTLTYQPHTAEDVTPKSVSSFNAVGSLAIILAAIDNQSPQNRHALLLAEASKHCMVTAS